MKSGTNSLHGTAYAFGRDSAMDARNYFNPAPSNAVPQLGPQPLASCAKRPVALEQFGATVAGPLLKISSSSLRVTKASATRSEIFSRRTFPKRSRKRRRIQQTAFRTPSRFLWRAPSNSGLVPAPSALSLKLTGCTLTPAISCTGGLYPTNNATSKSFPKASQAYSDPTMVY